MIRAVAGVVAIVVALSVAAPAQAAEISGSTGLTRVRVNRLLEQSAMPDVPGLRVILGGCPDDAVDSAGCTFEATGSPVWVEPHAALGGFVLFHELGHRVRFDLLSAAAADHFLRIMRYRAWDADTTEQFADAYASCAMDWRPRTRLRPGQVDELFPTANGYEPTASQQRRVCSLIVRDAFTPS